MMDFELSPQGQARRDHILELAIGQARRHRRRRLAFRAGIICVALGAIGVVLLPAPRRPLDSAEGFARRGVDPQRHLIRGSSERSKDNYRAKSRRSHDPLAA